MMQYRFNFWFEWGCREDFCPCLWSEDAFTKEKYGHCADIHKLPISEDLVQFLCALGIEHDNALDWGGDSEALLWTAAEEKAFYRKAREGHKRLQEELGEEFYIAYCEKENENRP